MELFQGSHMENKKSLVYKSFTLDLFFLTLFNFLILELAPSQSFVVVH